MSISGLPTHDITERYCSPHPATSKQLSVSLLNLVYVRRLSNSWV